MRRGAPDTGKSASRKPPQLATTTDGAAAKVAAVEELSSLAGVLELEEQRRRPGTRTEASSSQKGDASSGSDACLVAAEKLQFYFAHPVRELELAAGLAPSPLAAPP